MYEAQRDILHEQGYKTAFRDRGGKHYLTVSHDKISYHFKGHKTVESLFDTCLTTSASCNETGFHATFRING